MKRMHRNYQEAVDLIDVLEFLDIWSKCSSSSSSNKGLYFVNDKINYSQNVIFMIFKPFSQEKYLFIMTLAVNFKQCKKSELI